MSMFLPPTFQRWPLALFAAWLASSLGQFSACAADDDEIVSAAAKAQQDADTDENFDQWLFPGVNDAAAGRLRIETQVKLQLAELERACQLTDAQKQRLHLAARGDMQRFLDEADVLRRKYDKVKHDQEAANQMWQELQPLQAKQARGLTGHGSLFAKILPRTLTPEQSAQYETVLNERRRFRYQASIAYALTSLEGSVALKHEQREALTKMLLELPPPHVFGREDHYLILYRLAAVPAEKLQPLFDARQWQGLTQQMNQARGMREYLIEQGMLLPEDLDESKKAAAPLAPLREAAP